MVSMMSVNNWVMYLPMGVKVGGEEIGSGGKRQRPHGKRGG
jgi:hypothetical protein